MRRRAYNVRDTILPFLAETAIGLTEGGRALETSFSELKCKFVVNVTDGRNLGKTNDIVFTYPEGRVLGIVVPGGRGLRLFKNNDMFISLKSIVKIGADVVLVDLKSSPKPDRPCKKPHYEEYCQPERPDGRRSFEEYE